SMNIAILSPVWFAVPPSGYGGIEWIVSPPPPRLAGAARHDDLSRSRRPPRRRSRRDPLRLRRLAYQGSPLLRLRARAERADRQVAPGPAPRPRLFRQGRRIRRHQRPLWAARGRARRPRRDPGSAHGARAARGRPRTRLRRAWPARPGRPPDLDLAQSQPPHAA